jgi:hypothetical protein
VKSIDAKDIAAAALKSKLQSGINQDHLEGQPLKFQRKYKPEIVAEMLGWSVDEIYRRIKFELRKEEHGISVKEGLRNTYRIPESVVIRWEREDTHPLLDKQTTRRKPPLRVVKFADLGKLEG